jgi:hypothetical protein
MKVKYKGRDEGRLGEEMVGRGIRGDRERE